VRRSADDAVERAERVVHARERYLAEAGTIGRGSRVYWVARELFDIIDSPWTYADRPLS